MGHGGATVIEILHLKDITKAVLVSAVPPLMLQHHYTVSGMMMHSPER